MLYWSLADVSIPARVAGSAFLVGISRLILTGSLPHDYVYLLGACPIVLSIWSRLPQILLNFRQGHTGQLALLTFGLSGLGNLARVFTTLKQTPDDTVSLISMLVSAILNFTLVLQIIVFWKATLKATNMVSQTKTSRKRAKKEIPA